MAAPYNPTVQSILINGGYPAQMAETVRRIGMAIKKCQCYPPIRNHAAAVATTAGPKDFLGQLEAVYDDFIKRWRYVKDPVHRELVTSGPEAVWRLTMAGDGVGVGLGKGAGDCDCATVALGSMLESIGFRTRIATTADKAAPPGRLFGHVFIQAQVPRVGWITVDPVLHPMRPFGAITPHSRIAYWDLNGNFLGAQGNYLGGSEKEINMLHGPNIDEWKNYGFAGVEEDDGVSQPVEWAMLGLPNWGYMDTPMGKKSTVAAFDIIDGSRLNGMMCEVDQNDEWGGGTVRTPMIELALDDYAYVAEHGQPYDGMLGLGDTGEVYAYDGLGGFFKKLFKRVKKGVRKVARRVKRGIKKVLKKTKFGRFLLKVGAKIKKIAMKVVKPLMKFVGKWAGKLAPIAALIPGFGPAIAGGLAVAGKVAKVMNRFNVKTHGERGKVRNLKFKDPKQLPAFKKALHAEASRMKAWSKRNPKKFREMSTKLARG